MDTDIIKPLIEGRVNVRINNKWKKRWCRLIVHSDNGNSSFDILSLHLYKLNEKKSFFNKSGDSTPNSVIKISKFIGVHSNFLLDKQLHTIALIGTVKECVLAFDSQLDLNNWVNTITVSQKFDKESRYDLFLTDAPQILNHSLAHFAILYLVQDQCSLVSLAPFKMLASWKVENIEKAELGENEKLTIQTSFQTVTLSSKTPVVSSEPCGRFVFQSCEVKRLYQSINTLKQSTDITEITGQTQSKSLRRRSQPNMHHHNTTSESRKSQPNIPPGEQNLTSCYDIPPSHPRFVSSNYDTPRPCSSVKSESCLYDHQNRYSSSNDRSSFSSSDSSSVSSSLEAEPVYNNRPPSRPERPLTLRPNSLKSIKVVKQSKSCDDSYLKHENCYDILPPALPVGSTNYSPASTKPANQMSLRLVYQKSSPIQSPNREHSHYDVPMTNQNIVSPANQEQSLYAVPMNNKPVEKLSPLTEDCKLSDKLIIAPPLRPHKPEYVKEFANLNQPLRYVDLSVYDGVCRSRKISAPANMMSKSMTEAIHTDCAPEHLRNQARRHPKPFNRCV